MDFTYFLIFIAILILLILVSKAFAPLLFGSFALVKHGAFYNYDDSEEDNIPASISGSADALREYLNGATPVLSHATIDAKNLTQAKLKSVSNKQFPLESFIDSLISNTLTYLISLDKTPTDLAIANLTKNKMIINNAADTLDKKYPESRISVADLRSLADKITSKSKSVSDRLTKLGNISKEDLAVKYCELLSSGSQPRDIDCKSKLQICEDRKTVLTNDIESIRKTNETLRDELRRGISSYNCETILRECRDEKDKLERRIRDLQSGPSSADEQRRRADKLQTEVNELREIARLLQNEGDTQYQQQVKQLQSDLNECESLKVACIAQLNALGYQ